MSKYCYNFSTAVSQGLAEVSGTFQFSGRYFSLRLFFNNVSNSCVQLKIHISDA